MPDRTSGNTKLTIITALIAAGATVATALIGVLPQMRKTDRAAIEDYKKQIAALKATGGLYRISGQVKGKNNAPFTDAVIYAASADDSAPLDDNGTFLFQNMSRKPYVVVLASQSGAVHRLLIDPQNPTTGGEDLAINYAFVPEQTP